VMNNLNDLTRRDFQITLTDKFPNIRAYKYLNKITDGKINFIDKSVDATRVPKDLNGIQTIFSAFHHFSPTAASTILRNAVHNNKPIGIFDGGDKNLLVLVGMIFIHPIVFFLFTPFIKPFRISRIFFTYVFPLIPFCTIWDGVVSIGRLHEPKNLRKLIHEADPHKKYLWQVGKANHKFGLKVAYILGYSQDYAEASKMSAASSFFHSNTSSNGNTFRISPGP